MAAKQSKKSARTAATTTKASAAKVKPTADIGLIGLAVMGQNLVLNMNDHGFTVAVFNRTVSLKDTWAKIEQKDNRDRTAPNTTAGDDKGKQPDADNLALIGLDDFSKLQLKTARVLAADGPLGSVTERVPLLAVTGTGKNVRFLAAIMPVRAGAPGPIRNLQLLETDGCPAARISLADREETVRLNAEAGIEISISRQVRR